MSFRTFSSRAAAAACLLVVWAVAAHAQEPLESTTLPDAQIVQDTRPPVSPPATLDVGDLWRAVRHKDLEAPERGTAPPNAGQHFVVVAPTVGSKPTTGFTAGLNGNMAFFSSDPAATHISSVSAGFRVSQFGQVLSGARFAIFTPHDGWFVQGDNRVSWTSLNTYALGAVPQPTGTVNVRFDQIRLYETVYKRIDRGLYVGGGVNLDAHARVRPSESGDAPFDDSAYVAYSVEHGFSPARQLSTGTSVGLLYDTRDNAINARRGVAASTTYRTFFSALGGDSTWQELAFDARTYKALDPDGRRKLAFWTMGDFVTGGTAPFWDLPAIASDGRSARGYGEGRYRGEQLMYGEVEFRSTLTHNGLLGYVAFANVTTVSNADLQQRLFTEFAPAAGGGLRILLNKRSRTNLCADYGFGKSGSRGFYLAIQEAF
ncbi:MAG TPA: BamA/TamA family outer membrane protein [Vicinamibacterales bacterium]|nr:BamA/TamA family outer membrane protein [Vicinamibacterales bacterium]